MTDEDRDGGEKTERQFSLCCACLLVLLLLCPRSLHVLQHVRSKDRTRSSPLEERKKVFRDLQRQLHPDKNLHDQEAAKLAFQKLMESRDSYLS
eukprot:s8523_g2.t1